MAIAGSSCPRSLAVLIADDHDLIRMALRHVLARAGMWVLAAACNPLEAVDHARHPGVEIVILDLSWRTCVGIARREAGLAALQSIRTDRPGLPVLVYSTDATVESVKSCRRLGANGYLIKGIDDSRLVAAVRAVHAGETVWPSWLVDSTSADSGSPDSQGAAPARASAYVQRARYK